jgi:hypothetical protein
MTNELFSKGFFRGSLILAALGLVACSDRSSSDFYAEKTDEFADSGPSYTMQVAAVYNDDELQIRLIYRNAKPIWYHQYLVYENGEWIRYGSGDDGPDEHGFYEDRISMLWDDGSVRGFADTGGFVTVHQGMRTTRSNAPEEEVRDHPYIGGKLGESEVHKFIIESREDDGNANNLWKNIRNENEIMELRERGIFLDLWQWRAHRSHPVGYADNGYVLEHRHGSSGRSMYSNNVDSETGQPKMMFDPAKAGKRALRFEKLIERAYSQKDAYYLVETEGVPFDPDHNWQEGDALPHRLLRQPQGSRGAIRASGGYENGAWRIQLTRSLEAPDPLDSKSFEPGKVYHVAFAVHSGGAGGRHHWISMPISFSLDQDTDLQAQYTQGRLDRAEAEWTTVILMDPGDPTLPRP